jgi:outer membrane protein assembly factor BamC
MNGRIALSLIFMLGSLTACSTISNMLQGDKLDYRTASTVKAKTLDIPPDLSTLPQNDRYAIPDRAGTATASTYNLQKPAVGVASTGLLPTVADAHIERAGGQRWLVVNRKPEEIWTTIHEFWQDSGFLIKTESQETGIMETDWAENRAKIPLDIIRDTIGKIFDGLYSTGELDKFRTRIERTPDGGSEIYISHRGMVENFSDAQKTTTIWQPRPADPELEAEFLRRLLVRFGTEPERAKAIVAAGATAPAQANLVNAAEGGYVELNDSFDRAWRRVGLALDRVGFTVEDRDRNQGIYFVRYVDPNAEVNQKKDGFFSRLFTSEDKLKEAIQYRVVVKTQGTAQANTTRISVQSKDGVAETGPVGKNILTLLNEQLK